MQQQVVKPCVADSSQPHDEQLQILPPGAGCGAACGGGPGRGAGAVTGILGYSFWKSPFTVSIRFCVNLQQDSRVLA